MACEGLAAPFSNLSSCAMSCADVYRIRHRDNFLGVPGATGVKFTVEYLCAGLGFRV